MMTQIGMTVTSTAMMNTMFSTVFAPLEISFMSRFFLTILTFWVACVCEVMNLLLLS